MSDDDEPLEAGQARQETAGLAPSSSRPLTELAVQALPLAVVLALMAFMADREGGFAGTVWYPVTLFTLGVAAALAVGDVRRMRSGRAVFAAIGLLAAFTVWSYASIGWAADRGVAWDGSNRGLLYLLVFGLLALWPVSERAVWPLVFAAAIVVTAEGVSTVEQAASAAHPSQFMVETRLSDPLGYPNATAALFMTATWLMIGLGSRRWLPIAVRGIAFGVAVLDVTLNLLTQSRGSIYTLPLVAVAYLLLVPGRLRSLAAIAIVAVGSAAAVAPALAVFSTDSALQLRAGLRHALEIGLVCAVGTAFVGLLFAALDKRIRPSPRTVRLAGVAVALGALLAVVGFSAAYQPWTHVGPAWHSFKYQGEPNDTSSHFGGLGSQRYDFWRVGLIEFKKHPIEGIGTDNFLIQYLQLRHGPEQPAYPHSLVIRLLSQTGIVGTALFAGFLVLLLLVVLRIPAGRERDLAGILTAGASVWLIHGALDWLWEIPALGVLGMALLGTACGLAPRPARRPGPIGRLGSVALAVGATVLAGVAAATLLLPWLAERDVQRATAVWRQNPQLAFALLNDADRFNPLSNQADLIGGAIASRLSAYEAMRTSFGKAVTRSPDDWYGNLELGVAASLTGDHALAAASLRRARELDPGEQVVQDVWRTFAAGGHLDSHAIDRELAAGD